MLLPRLQPPLRAAITSIGRQGPLRGQQACLNEAFAQLAIKKTSKAPGLNFVRYASHNAQGAVNGAKDGPGKRLGAKRSGEQYVIPGNIIFRQRGTLWFPGDNCAMGRDHSIYATQPGYVKYYKDPEKHPKRQYIGVVFERNQVLPLPRNSMRRRRLGMVAQKMEAPAEQQVDAEAAVLDVDGGVTVQLTQTPKNQKEITTKDGRTLRLRPGYMYRESNWEIGRAAERAQIKVREFTPGDRWVAWRKSAVRKAKTMEKISLGRKVGKSKK